MDPSEVPVHHKLEKEEQPIAAEIRVELGKETEGAEVIWESNESDDLSQVNSKDKTFSAEGPDSNLDRDSNREGDWPPRHGGVRRRLGPGADSARALAALGGGARGPVADVQPFQPAGPPRTPAEQDAGSPTAVALPALLLSRRAGHPHRRHERVRSPETGGMEALEGLQPTAEAVLLPVPGHPHRAG